MKKQILVIALLNILLVNSYSQIIFENGYFIDESNKRTECLIKNIDWKNNPTGFEYKLSPEGAIQKATIQTVKGFGINGYSRYTRAIVNIDRSSDRIDEMSTNKEPEFKEELLFLKVLIEGKASLLGYFKGNFTRFFYKTNDSEVKQLVCKQYLTDNKNSIASNNFYRQQLFTDLICQEISMKDVDNIKYEQKGLEQLFIKYNKCTNSDYTSFQPTQKKDMFNLSLRPGINYGSLSVKDIMPTTFDIHFGNRMSFRFGIESEFILPFNKNKWSVIFEPTYQYYRSENKMGTSYLSGGILVSNINYQSIELPVGVRHYLFINNTSKIFVNISYMVDLDYNSSIELKRIDGSFFDSLVINPRYNAALGLGYKFKDKLSLELRINTTREILSEYVLWVSKYKTASIILGYSLF